MKLYEFIANIEIVDEEIDTYYQLIVAKNKKEAFRKFDEKTIGLRILENSIICEEIKEIDGYKIKVEEK